MGYFFLEENQIASKYWATGYEFDITKRFCGLKNNKNKKKTLASITCHLDGMAMKDTQAFGATLSLFSSKKLCLD